MKNMMCSKKFAAVIMFVLIMFMIVFIFPDDLHARASDNAADDVVDSEITIIRLSVNGEEKDISPQILNKDGVIYVPVSGALKFLFGSFVDYSSRTTTITAVNRYATIFTNKINTDIISVNGGKIKISECSFRKSGDCYVTSEFLHIVFGVNCKFDEISNTVIISQTTETDRNKLPQEIQDLDLSMLLRHYQPENLERYVTYKKSHADLAYSDVVTYVNIGLDFPYYSGMVAQQVKNPESNLVLCNKYNYLPDDYVPDGYKKSDGRVLAFKSEAQGQFDKMRADASKSGVNIYIVSGYRSYAVQNQIYNNYKRQDPNGADTYSARPGYSEHQTGLAADLNSASASSHFENTKAYAWLAENAYKYGFILRYPKNKEWITGYIFEPWHWRYVGVKIAGEIKDSGLTYDEYYAIYLVPQNPRFLGTGNQK